MLMNTDHHHHHRRNRTNDAAETFHLHITNKPDSQPDSSDSMSSTQTSPVAPSQWSYREQPVPDSGSLVFSGSADSNVCVWRRDDGGEHKCVYVLRGHSGPVKCLAVDVSGGDGVGERAWTVYSGSLDRSVKIWRVCAQTVKVERREPVAPTKQKDGQRRTGFQRFTDQGRLNQRRK
ncbi:hypothetical protein L1987_71645 [Smallanthus sonchifolius]|uniref:Uncharacterized protein n=1 Tax=Smallanthus sonchifolius TaxID=185202 RepID=A0ACB9ASM2_9ASTR|nr:hypothetical protein L1987_71645 [Smallanthus sonchifolius]